MKNSFSNKKLDELKDGVFFAARGGGVRSCVSIGMLKALEEANIPVKGVSGESLSSIFAALLAYGYNADKIMELFLEYNETLTKASKLFGGRGSIVIEEEVNKVTNNILLRDLPIPCYINSCTGKLLKPDLVLFSNEKNNNENETLGTACRASASLPVLFGNFKKTINGKEVNLFDGGFLFNPYIPSTDYPVLFGNFYNTIDYYELFPSFACVLMPAKVRSDVVISAPVGGVLITGSNKDMIKCYDAGYEEARKLLDKLDTEKKLML